MNTPIYDFVTEYNKKKPSRMHMPGHKGLDSLLGIEHMDITEIDGADNLWAAEGIIAESERNASEIFGCPTFYSTEGSSLAIRGMLFLIKKWCHINNRSFRILAARNAHKTFINTAALLDMEVEWIMQQQSDSYQACHISAVELDSYLNDISASCDNTSQIMPAALYLTSPDYLGNVADIQAIADVCHKHGLFLLVDNAHGAYLKFIKNGSDNRSYHPIDLGADMCCDSAHKTLPVLTGGAYLHVRKCSFGIEKKFSESDYSTDGCSTDNGLIFFEENAKSAMAMFGSTSPSYLIMQSLDLCNSYLYNNSGAYSNTGKKIALLKSELISAGYTLKGDEPIKITIDAKAYGYYGYEISEYLVNNNVYVEYYDDDYIVFMITPMTDDTELSVLKDLLISLPMKSPIADSDFGAADCQTDIARVQKPYQAMPYSAAIMSNAEVIPAAESVGRILAEPAVSTPPCVPVYMCGERIDTIPPVDTVKVVKN